MNWLLIAGGIITTPTPTTPVSAPVETINHTLLAETLPAKQVVTRNRWGTPMLPNDKGGYSLIQGIVEANIAQSLIQPPRTGGPVFRPGSTAENNVAE